MYQSLCASTCISLSVPLLVRMSAVSAFVQLSLLMHCPTGCSGDASQRAAKLPRWLGNRPLLKQNPAIQANRDQGTTKESSH